MLSKTSVSFSKTGTLSKIMKDYLAGDEKLKSFYGESPSIESFKKQIELKRKENIDRGLLTKILQEQYEDFEVSDSSQNNLNLLQQENTFTVTTGHQLCLFTGPLYFIYKIITIINLVEELTQKYPSNNFVPIYWMASEDHDFEEISFFNVFSKKVKWQTYQTGAVGEMENSELEDVFIHLKEILGDSENANELFNLFKDSYLNHNTLADATRYLVNKLFGKYGLIIIDGNNSDLKKQFLTVTKADIFEQKTFESVLTTNQQLKKNYKVQVNPREINFFYLNNGVRERIIKQGEEYRINNKGISFSESELRQEIENYPERFSPNVILRPLYQETILPNLAYIGGGGELAYWLQLKKTFESYNIVYPILFLRNSALVISKSEANKLSKLGLSIEDIFQANDELIKVYLRSNSSVSFAEEKMIIDALYQQLGVKAAKTDASLSQMVLSEKKQAEKSLVKIESKILKAQKRAEETTVNQIEKLKQKLFPNNSLQEREVNFSEFYLKWGSIFLEEIKENLEPFSEYSVFKES